MGKSFPTGYETASDYWHICSSTQKQTIEDFTAYVWTKIHYCEDFIPYINQVFEYMNAKQISK